MQQIKRLNEEVKPCPLCGTMLPYDKWLKVVGVYEEQQKHRKQLELELNKAKEQEAKLKQKEKEMRTQYNSERSKLKLQSAIQQKKLREKFEKEKQKFQQEQEKIKKRSERQKQIELKQAHQKGVSTGIEKQKARTEKASQMAEKARKERDRAMEKVKQLEEMIKKGTTPQIEGFEFEREFVNQLKKRFPEDHIQPTGHKGDIIQTVRVKDRKIGKILYECKKTKEFENKFIEQIQRDKASVIADYGVVVTWATKVNKQNFWLEGDIIVVHPYGALDIATFLRETLIQMYTLKLSKAEFETKGKAILEFIQSEEFRTRIQNSITKSREAYDVLQKEMKTHVDTWNRRFKIYEDIHRNTNIIQGVARYILLHGKIPKNLPLITELPPLQTSSQKEQKEPDVDVKDIPF